jgi:hypothetical protein
MLLCVPESRRVWVTRGGVVVVCIMYVCMYQVCMCAYINCLQKDQQYMYVHMCGSLVYAVFNFNTNT